MDVVITEDTLWMISNYAFISATTLWIADFIETLPTEINAIWRKKLTGASVLFLINRYIFLLSLIPQAFIILPGNDDNKQCDVNANILGVLQILAIAITNALFALRVYAIYNKNRIILGTCSIFILSRLGIEILEQITYAGSSSAGTQFQSFSACGLDVHSNVFIQCGLDLLYMEFLSNPAIGTFIIPFLALVYDIYIFGLTMRKTIDLGFKMKRQGQSSVAHIIVQDAILTGITLKDQTETADLISSIFSPFFDFLPNILISRLMLNLRTFPTPGTGDTLTTSQRAQFSSLHFASNQMLGNIGAPLDGGSFNEEGEEKELNEVEIEMETIREERQGLEINDQDKEQRVKT
ncbi:hypothetical protein GGU10DRAFT_332318 [Lentinula aff. detonsa]|uniref:DUF6533 domain-containing protein n=1 Tax=Lentinula aff. detonsa TaxID=2804958 RepID=A0AA38NMB5_9AGAR|nr:hypothetical protein GGU10DRAFT_332318 [Lentinula aff. detonsa]